MNSEDNIKFVTEFLFLLGNPVDVIKTLNNKLKFGMFIFCLFLREMKEMNLRIKK